jgi:hypothetical protein
MFDLLGRFLNKFVADVAVLYRTLAALFKRFERSTLTEAIDAPCDDAQRSRHMDLLTEACHRPK